MGRFLRFLTLFLCKKKSTTFCWGVRGGALIQALVKEGISPTKIPKNDINPGKTAVKFERFVKINARHQITTIRIEV